MTTDSLERLPSRFAAQHALTRRAPWADHALRADRLARLAALLERHGPALVAAVAQDFGVRSRQLTEIADLMLLRQELRTARRQLARWMRPRRVPTAWPLWPGRGFILPQPLGVVGVIAPWNYPLQLAIAPVLSALAAGNRVLLKPSEHTPATSARLAEAVADLFDPLEWAVLQGGAEMAEAFAALPFDHLFFTGSTAVGRKVAQAAAANLTPTTLELGGKSPCIVTPDAPLDVAARRIAHGKLLNAGQTCIAPDYVLLPQGREQAFIDAFGRAAQGMFARFQGNPDYASIVSPRQHERLLALLDDAQAQGARLHAVGPAPEPASGHPRQLAPVLLTGVHAGMRVLQEEIFGPILPLLPYQALDDAIRHINAGPRPLAVYAFGADAATRQHLLRATTSGGVSLDDTLMHVAHEHLPFGGVGPSGWGAYHGQRGFDQMSHLKPVFAQSRWGRPELVYPPYGARFDRVMGGLRRLFS